MEQTITFPSKAESLQKVEILVDELCEKYKVNEDFYGNILIALTEGVNNAIHHGNKSNPSKEVKLVASENEGVLSFVISDDGPGFDYNNLPDPTDPKNIEKPHGRGVFLMKNLADNIEFFDDGSTVRLDFDINDDLLLEAASNENDGNTNN
jgi:serine/threonine-protein kinase RsbW